MREMLAECLILSTCNRTEIYAVANSNRIDPQFYKDLLVDFKNARGLVEDNHFFTHIACPASQQLFGVATSIDSRVVGDTQILKQLRNAYFLASEYGAAGKILNQLLQRAFKIGKKTYTETSIHSGAVSVSLAAVELAVETFGSLHGRTVMVVGAGETARLTAEALINRRVGKILFSNRTRSRAEEMLAALAKNFVFDSEIIDFTDFKNRLDDAEIVITATGSDEPILKRQDIEGRNNRILLIDIAVPRDIETEVAENPNVVLRNIDDLNVIIDGAHMRRMEDLPKVEKLIRQELADFLTWYYTELLLPSFEKSIGRPDVERTRHILKIKSFLNTHLDQIHQIASESSGDFQKDLRLHVSLVARLNSLKAAAFGAAAA
jgi:glutamyl-tRNA reductase